MPKSKKLLLAPPLKSVVVPARSKIAVNKSILGMNQDKIERLSKLAESQAKKKADDQERLGEVFERNLEIVIALLPMVSFTRKFLKVKAIPWAVLISHHWTLHWNLHLNPDLNLFYVDANVVRKWIKKLLDPASPLPKRNQFLSFMVFQIQNMKISDPFDKDPPKEILSDGGKTFSVRLHSKYWWGS